MHHARRKTVACALLWLLSFGAAPRLPAQEATNIPRPRALVFEHEDRWTHSAGATAALAAAGFEVGALPLDRDPAEADLVVLGSFVSEHADYAAFMKAHAAGLLSFVERGGVVLQFTQADQVEARPPFLPKGLTARRDDADHAEALVLAPKHPLLAAIPGGESRWKFSSKRTLWEGFAEQSGFAVLVAPEASGGRGGLLEAAHGKGRLLLASLAPDKLNLGIEGDDAFAAARRSFASAFFAALRGYVVAVKAGTAPAPVPSAHAAEPAPLVPGAWSIVVLPDTQNYSQYFPGLFTLQTTWILDHQQDRDLRFVLQLGDITNTNAPGEWRNAQHAMARLFGRIPVALVPGNHDYGPRGNASTRDTLLNTYFPFEQTARQPTFGGAFEDGRLENTFHLFDAGGTKWIVIALEWAPRDDRIAWANEIMARHPDRRGILITHAYMNNNDRRYDHQDREHPQLHNPHAYQTPGPLNDGEELWTKLVRRHDFALVLNGHVLGDGTGHLASRTDKGRTCHQMLSNYQMRELGGEGYLRLLEFHPDGRTVQVRSYSPLHDRHLTTPDQQFVIVLD